MTDADTTLTVEVLGGEADRPHARAAVDFIRGLALQEGDEDEQERLNRIREEMDTTADGQPLTLSYEQGKAVAAALYAYRNKRLDDDDYAAAANIEQTRRAVHQPVAEVDPQ